MSKYGEENLSSLIISMEPTIQKDEYIFFTTKNRDDIEKLTPLCIFHEEEGISMIILKSVAVDNSIDFDSSFRCITLKVHSSLNAIGLTAVISTALAKEHISANVVAGYYHDHIFVPSALAQKALLVLKSLS